MLSTVVKAVITGDNLHEAADADLLGEAQRVALEILSELREAGLLRVET